MIPKQTISAIIEAARIEEVVADFVSLKKRGSNLIGVCPFHQEKTPSFTVSPGKNIFKCFGCGKSGDSIRFVMEHEHYSYVEALRYLARKYNITIEEKEQTPEEIMAQNERERMFNINAFASNYFSDSLWNTEEGLSIGLSYFQERGFLRPIIERFQLGYNINQRDAFTKHAINSGYAKDLLLKIGLSVGGDDRVFDRFQGRVMFPIHNLTGKVIGFGGRTLSTDKKTAKYVNSPESEIYDKKQTLYGIFFAKNAITRADSCILVEGYFDVLRMHQLGMENVVASSGTSLTKEQIRLIKRYTNNVTMLYDGDAAGIKAALRGTDMILEEGMNVRVVVLPEGHDPDSFARDYPLEEVQRYLEDNRRDFIGFKTEILLRDAQNDPIKKAQVVRDILDTIAIIPDPIYRSTYLKECSILLDMSEQTLVNELNKILRKKFKKSLGSEGDNVPDVQTVVTPQEQIPTSEEEHSSGYYLECELIKLLLLYGDEILEEEADDEDGQKVKYQFSVAQMIVDDLRSDNIVFSDTTNQTILQIYGDALDRGEPLPSNQFFTSHEDEAISQLTINLLSTQYKLDEWGRYGIQVKTESDDLDKTVLSVLYRYKDFIMEQKSREMDVLIKDATDVENQLILLAQKKRYDDIRKEINRILGIVIVR